MACAEKGGSWQLNINLLRKVGLIVALGGVGAVNQW